MPFQLQQSLPLPIDVGAATDPAGTAVQTGQDGGSFPDLLKPGLRQAQAGSGSKETALSGGKSLPQHGNTVPVGNEIVPGLPVVLTGPDRIEAAMQAVTAQPDPELAGIESPPAVPVAGSPVPATMPALPINAPGQSTPSVAPVPATPHPLGTDPVSQNAVGRPADTTVASAVSTAVQAKVVDPVSRSAPGITPEPPADDLPAVAPVRGADRSFEAPPSRLPDRGLVLPSDRLQRVASSESPILRQGLAVTTANGSTSIETASAEMRASQSMTSSVDERGGPQIAQRTGQGPLARVVATPINTPTLQAEAGMPVLPAAAATTQASFEAGRRTVTSALEPRALRGRDTSSGITRAAAESLSGMQVSNALRQDAAAVVKPELIEPRPGIDARYERVPITPPPAPATNGLATTAGPHAPGSVTTSTSLSIATPVFDPAWSETVGKQVAMLVSRNVRGAELRLSPAELGPVQVQLSVDDNVAKVAFTAGQAVTREALEQALPRLRDMLADQGVTLGEASVSDQRGQRGDSAGDGGNPAAVSYAAESETSGEDAVSTSATAGTAERRGLLDTYI